MICSKCGNNCNDKDTCCTNCGYSLTQNNNSVNNNYTIPNNGQYQNMNNNLNKKSKNSIKIIIIIVLVAIIVIVTILAIILFPFIKNILKKSEIKGEWYCSESSYNVNQEESSTHMYFNSDNTFTFGKNGDELNNYYSGDYKIVGIEVKFGDENYTSYEIETNSKERKIDGVNNNRFDDIPNSLSVTINHNDNDDSNNDKKLHAVFVFDDSSRVLYCVKKDK